MVTLYIDPCPFCKYERPAIEYHYYLNSSGNGFDVAWIKCPNCEAEGPHESMPFGMTVQEAAIQAWNER